MAKPIYRPLDTMDVVVKIRPGPRKGLGSWQPSLEERKELKELKCVKQIFLSCGHVGWHIALTYSGVGQMEDRVHEDKVEILKIIAKWDQKGTKVG
jgi:hypothetical protein